MEYKEKVKYLDFLIENIENAEMFDIYTVFYKNTKLEHSEINSIVFNLESFGYKSNLFEKMGDNKRLTPKGEKLKSFKKGFEKFEKSLTKTPLTLYQKIHLPITIISLLGTFTFSYLTLNYKGKNDTLIKREIILKDSISKLKSKIELHKVLLLNDTLQSNN